MPTFITEVPTFKKSNSTRCRTRWPSGLKLESEADRLLGLRFRIPPGAWVSVCSECCVLSGKSIGKGPIPRPEKLYKLPNWNFILPLFIKYSIELLALNRTHRNSRTNPPLGRKFYTTYVLRRSLFETHVTAKWGITLFNSAAMTTGCVHSETQNVRQDSAVMEASRNTHTMNNARCS